MPQANLGHLLLLLSSYRKGSVRVEILEIFWKKSFDLAAYYLDRRNIHLLYPSYVPVRSC